jgi:FkbM family methyltransferase
MDGMDITADSRLRLIDVGGSGGLEPEWHPYADRLLPTMFEPNPDAAADLIARGHHTLQVALSSLDGTRPLYITRNPLCTSLHRPNMDLAASYDAESHFEVVRTIPIECRRYDSLHHEGAVAAPDAIKIDTQGHEFGVLLGFGGLLAECLGIVLETHTVPMYHGERLLCDIVELLASFGLALRRLEQTPAGAGDFIEANAYFTANRSRSGRLGEAARAKFDLLHEVWRLPSYTA